MTILSICAAGSCGVDQVQQFLPDRAIAAVEVVAVPQGDGPSPVVAEKGEATVQLV